MIEDPRVDAYIDRAAPFARPILHHLRAIIRATCPQVEESIKWSRPSFIYQGKILCGISAFKQHASFGFWDGERATGGEVGPEKHAAMGQFGRLTSIEDLPDSAALTRMILKAMALIDSGERQPRLLKHPKPPVEAPDDFVAALATVPAAKAFYDGLPAGQRREYVDWITESKRAETRQRRIAQAILWLAEGKRRNWKYENC